MAPPFGGMNPFADFFRNLALNNPQQAARLLASSGARPPSGGLAGGGGVGNLVSPTPAAPLRPLADRAPAGASAPAPRPSGPAALPSPRGVGFGEILPQIPEQLPPEEREAAEAARRRKEKFGQLAEALGAVEAPQEDRRLPQVSANVGSVSPRPASGSAGADPQLLALLLQNLLPNQSSGQIPSLGNLIRGGG